MVKTLGKAAMVAALCAVAFGAFPARAEQPCTNVDLSVGHSCGYHVRLGDLPLNFEYNASGAPSDMRAPDPMAQGQSVAVAAIKGAVDAWNAYWPLKNENPLCPALCYSRATSLQAGVRDGHHVIQFGDPADCGSTGAAVACAWYRGSSGQAALQIAEVDIILNASYDWEQVPAVGNGRALGEIAGAIGGNGAGWIDLQSVLTHEMGHALGLEHVGDPSKSYPGSAGQAPYARQTMYFKSFEGSTHPRTPEEGDVAALQYAAYLSAR